jgi:hypothetical protein
MDDLVWLVRNKGGLKVKELMWELATKSRNDPNRPAEALVMELIDELVDTKRLIEVEYTSDFMEVQSFLLPARTSINVRGQENVPRRI